MRRAPRGLLRGFWCLIRQGLSVREAAAGAGVLERRCWRWFSEAGGMPPLQLAVSARHLSLADRERIFAGLVAGCSYAAIARSIGRPTSTVTRVEVSAVARSRRPQIIRR
jgi:transposase, IS30 family